MADVQTLRDFVRAQLDVDDEELPNSLLNIYLQEAFDRTLAADNRWPRNEYTWNIAKADGDETAPLPADVNIPGIMSVISITDGYRLTHLVHENAEDLFPDQYTVVENGVKPVYYSIWQRQIFLWPKVGTEGTTSLQLRGYRQPVWDNNASAIPDLDERLHIPLCYFAIALAYAAQEDEVLEGVYMARWQRDVNNAMKTMLEPSRHRPLVLHGGAPIGGVPGFVVNLPDAGP